MKHAITTLRNALEVAENNEPIARAEGRTEEADLRVAEIESFRRGIWLLEGWKATGLDLCKPASEIAADLTAALKSDNVTAWTSPQ